MRQVVADNVDFTTLRFGITDDNGSPLFDDTGERIVTDNARSLDETAIATVFDRIVSTSHEIAVRADVLFDRQTIVEGLPITGGSITWDRTASILASCTATIADETRIPVAPDDVLTPYGYELMLWRGVAAGGGTIVAPLGVFPIQRSKVNGVTFVSTIAAKDRSQLVSDARIEDVYQIPSGTNYATAIETLITDGVPGLEFAFPSTSFATPTLTFGPDDNRWEAAQQMARSIGNELLFDGLGRCVMRQEPSFRAEPDATISEGDNLLEADVELDRGAAYNKVIATSSNASLGDTFRGEAFDDDPTSPTYYFGPFGRKARRYASPFLASNEQCESAAAAILASNLGVARSLTVMTLPNPRIEPSDLVSVIREPLGIDDIHIVDTVTLGLTASSALRATVRAQQEAA